MKHPAIKSLTLVVVTAIIAASCASRGFAENERPDPAAKAVKRDLNDREVRQIFNLLFASRTRTALTVLDSLAPTSGEYPLYHLMRARAYREFLPVDDENKDRLKAMARSVYDELDRTIAICTQRLNAGDADPRLYLYRGWAWMFRSHVHTFERSMWSAGKEAKRGKKDLDKYLAIRPRDPVAGSIMGAFLYFADTLPSAYKFVSKLLFLPGGDRNRGLQMMELSVGWDSIVENDNRLILYSVDIGFEGRFEEGLEGFDALIRNHPHHSTFLRPLAVLMPLRPRYRESDGDKLDVHIDALASSPKGESEVATYWLLRFMQAYADRFYNPVRAAERFQSIIEVNPESPDWVSAYSRFELARMFAAQGRVDDTRAVLDSLLADKRGKYIYGEAQAILKHLNSDGSVTAPDPTVVRDIYLSPAGAQRARAHFESADPRGAADFFYLGEALLALGDNDGAEKAYLNAADTDSPVWDDSFRMLGAARAGEVAATEGRYRDAAAYYKHAREFWHKEFVYDWLLESRARYFKRLADGKEQPPVVWFAAAR